MNDWLEGNPIIRSDYCLLTAARTQEFGGMRADLAGMLIDKEPLPGVRWQQLDISASPAHALHELLNVTIWYDMPETMRSAQKWMEPDMPWAEAHFRERVGGEPINPGVEHENWPYHAQGADLHLRHIYDSASGSYQLGYDHNYMERFWAKRLRDTQHDQFWGYRFPVGDLDDVLSQLMKDPTTRQAYLPMFFPEDTGATENQRVPCSLGYHFMIRDNKLHVQYVLRSCEIYRHFTNDMYMAVRLGQWVRDKITPALRPIKMGQLTVQIANLHSFVGDDEKLREMMVEWLS